MFYSALQARTSKVRWSDSGKFVSQGPIAVGTLACEVTIDRVGCQMVYFKNQAHALLQSLVMCNNVQLH